ncbi:MAG: hypothetical protein ACFB0G_16365 [Leptolyngbyaceae cyanobacterium]
MTSLGMASASNALLPTRHRECTGDRPQWHPDSALTHIPRTKLLGAAPNVTISNAIVLKRGK